LLLIHKLSTNYPLLKLIYSFFKYINFLG